MITSTFHVDGYQTNMRLCGGTCTNNSRTKIVLTMLSMIVLFLQSVPLHPSDANTTRRKRQNIPDTLRENTPTTGNATEVLEPIIPDWKEKPDGVNTVYLLHGCCRQCQPKTKVCNKVALLQMSIQDVNQLSDYDGWVCHSDTRQPCFLNHVTHKHDN